MLTVKDVWKLFVFVDYVLCCVVSSEKVQTRKMGRRKEKENNNKKTRKSKDREIQAEEEMNKEREEEGEDILYDLQERGGREREEDDTQSNGDGEISSYTETENDIYNNSIELLNEKKASSRLKGLQQILNVLQTSGVTNISMNSLNPLRVSLLRLIRHPTTTNEGVLATKILLIISLLIGPNDEFVELHLQPLKHVITRVDDELFRQKVLFALVFMSFICSTNRLDCFAWILCEELILQTSEGLEVSPKLKYHALKYWCLLSSVINPHLVLEHSRDGIFEAICSILEDNDTEGKVVAGESLALLWEIASLALPEGDESQWQRLICEDTREFDNLTASVRQISRDSSKRISKKEKKERKGTMRVVLDYILDGIPPEETIELRGAELEITTFSMMLLVQTLRDVLENGFQNCLESFPITR